MFHFIIAAVISLQTATIGSVQPPDSDVEPRPQVYDVLRAADEATKALRVVKYDAVREGTGAQAARIPVIEGTVWLASTENRIPNIRIDCTEYIVLELQGVVRKYNSVIKSGEAIRIDHHRELVIRGGGGTRSLGPGFNLMLTEFNHPAPFQDEMNSTRAILEGRAYVEKVLCDVVLVRYENGSRTRWYFGALDHLPRRYERLRTINDEAGAIVLTLSNLETEVVMDDASFTLEFPEGYQVKLAAPGSGIGGIRASRIPNEPDKD